MNYKSVIAQSWQATKDNKRLIIWYGFMPSLLTTLVGIFYLFYQVVATYRSPLFAHSQKSFLRELIETVINLIRQDISTGMLLLVIVIVIVAMYMTLPTIFQGGLIQLTARIHNNQMVRMRDGVSYGLLSFLRLFEYHLLIKGFGLFSFLAEAAFIGRNLGWEGLQLLFIPLLLFTIVGFILVLLFTYSDYFIVIDKEAVFSSMQKSAKLVITHFAETFLVAILMLIITIRIIFNILLVLLIPAIIIIPASYFATITLATVGYLIGGLLGLITLFFTSYLGGILEVFATFVWVKTFLELTGEGEVSARAISQVEAK